MDVREPHLAVEVGKVRTTPRDFPFQSIAKRVRFDRDQEQIIFARKVFGCCFSRLCCGREMDKPILNIDRCTRCGAVFAQRGPFGASENLVNQHEVVMPIAQGLVKWALSRFCRVLSVRNRFDSGCGL